MSGMFGTMTDTPFDMDMAKALLERSDTNLRQGMIERSDAIGLWHTLTAALAEIERLKESEIECVAVIASRNYELAELRLQLEQSPDYGLASDFDQLREENRQLRKQLEAAEKELKEDTKHFRRVDDDA